MSPTLYVASFPRAPQRLTTQDDGTPDKYDLPPPSTAGALAPSKDTSKGANGAPPEDDKENWSKVGWAPRFGTGETEEDKKDEGNLLDHQTFLEGKLDDKFFGGTFFALGICWDAY